MFSIGPMEMLLLACVGVPMFLGTIVVLLAAIRYLSKRSHQQKEPAPAVQALSHQDVLRTHYFRDVPVSSARICPRCRAVLAADAPEGLCPACLLAGGLEGNSLPPTSSGHGTPAGAGAVDSAALAAAFPNLEIVELLGQGGMGTVFKVRQKNLDRLAALKVIPPQAALDPTFAERFSREARALARLNHSSIVTVYDFGQTGGFYWLMMEYVDGPNLRQLMRSERIAPREALAIVPQICDALQYAHDQGIVHRDIKPENVLLDRSGRVKIADFGLAKLLGTASADFTLTHAQQVMGTPRYMAPEQIEHPLEVDHRADIYSLGVVIYEMLTGELPIGRFAPPSQKVQVDVRLDEIVLRTLEKEPARRYQRVSEVRTELESVSHYAAPSSARVSSSMAAQNRAIEQAFTLSRPAAAVPLGIVLAVAIGMVLGMLMMGAGVAMTVVPFFVPWNLDVWPFFGAGVGTLIGGAGAFFGSYNSYRQLAGAVDLMNSREITWFDYVLLGYGALGIVIMIPGIQGLLSNSSEEHVYPLLIIGGIVAFQGMMAMLWRWGARQRAIVASGGTLCSPAQQQWHTVRPGFFLAVGAPTLAIAAVWVVVLLDVFFMTSHWPLRAEHISMSGTEGARAVYGPNYSSRAIAQWSLSAAAIISTSLVFAALTLWRAVGPRQIRPSESGEIAVVAPLSHPAWPLVVAALGFATLFFPWTRLSLDRAVLQPDFKAELLPGTEYYGNTLREMTRMPQGVRYSASGLTHLGGVAAGLLAAAGAIAAGMATRRSLWQVQALIALAGGVLAVLAIVSLGHRIGEQSADLIIDEITRQGLGSFSDGDPSRNRGLALALSNYVRLQPAFGLYVAAAAAGLLILTGATQWAWAVGVPETNETPTGKPLPAGPSAKLAMDSDRELALAQVRGPGMGLIVSGVMGLLPIVLFCVAIPLSWAVLLPVKTDEFRLQPETTYKVGAAAMSHAPLASIGDFQPPVLLAQEAAPMRDMAMPAWGLLIVIVVGFALLVTLPSSILLILGGVKMRQLQSYGLVNFAAIIALLPLGPQWLISLPMGIWALAVLGKAEVKSAFR